jgi:hypothetical protein
MAYFNLASVAAYVVFRQSEANILLHETNLLTLNSSTHHLMRHVTCDDDEPGEKESAFESCVIE